MSKAVSVDLRVRALKAVAAGASHREAANRFGVSAASISRWRKREREQGEPRPLALGGDCRAKGMESQADTILAIMAANRDITLVEIRAALAEKRISASIAGLWRFFRRHGITLKKSRFTPASKTAPTS
jgi:transposase